MMSRRRSAKARPISILNSTGRIWIKWSFGHPAVRYLGQDKVLLAYYAGPPNCLSVHWARVNLKK